MLIVEVCVCVRSSCCPQHRCFTFLLCVQNKIQRPTNQSIIHVVRDPLQHVPHSESQRHKMLNVGRPLLLVLWSLFHHAHDGKASVRDVARSIPTSTTVLLAETLLTFKSSFAARECTYENALSRNTTCLFFAGASTSGSHRVPLGRLLLGVMR
jgi:hypothetical protein